MSDTDNSYMQNERLQKAEKILQTVHTDTDEVDKNIEEYLEALESHSFNRIKGCCHTIAPFIGENLFNLKFAKYFSDVTPKLKTLLKE